MQHKNIAAASVRDTRTELFGEFQSTDVKFMEEH